MSSISNQPSQVNQLPIAVDVPLDPKHLQEFLTLWLKRTNDAVNSKEGALYSLQEFINFNQYFTQGNPNQFRSVYRKVFDMVNLNGAPIPGNGTVAFLHGVTGLSQATLIYAGCTNTNAQYFSVMGILNVFLNATHVNFVNPSPFPLTACMVVAEYLKN